VSAVAVAAPTRKVRVLFPATSGEALAERTPISATLERVIRYPDGREQRPSLGLARR